MILPFGALEQHGPHLPLATDTLQAAHLARAIATDLDALLLPAIPFGETFNNAGYPGTVSLSPATVAAILTDLVRSLAGGPMAVSGLVVVNGDWGNRGPLAEAAAAMTEELPTIVLDYPGLYEASAELALAPPAAAGLDHAGDTETSMIHAIEPSLVRVTKAAACYPDLPDDLGVRRYQLHPFSASGVFGDPTAATAAKGHALLDAVVSRSLEEIDLFLARVHDR